MLTQMRNLYLLLFSFELMYQCLNAFLLGNIPLGYMLYEESIFMFWQRSAIKEVNDCIPNCSVSCLLLFIIVRISCSCSFISILDLAWNVNFKFSSRNFWHSCEVICCVWKLKKIYHLGPFINDATHFLRF